VRFLSSVGFNVTEALLRLPVLWLMVQAAGIPSVLAQGITLMVAFVARFRFHSLVVYRPQHRSPGSPLRPSNRANSSDDRV
jgi:dolichol-phosphate mannosyltransferase